MKTLILASLFSLSALAEVPTFYPREVTCQEIETAMAEYGTVKIYVKYLLGGEVFDVYSEKIRCRGFYDRSTMKVRDIDGYKCKVGYYCERRIDMGG